MAFNVGDKVNCSTWTQVGFISPLHSHGKLSRFKANIVHREILFYISKFSIYKGRVHSPTAVNRSLDLCPSQGAYGERHERSSDIRRRRDARKWSWQWVRQKAAWRISAEEVWNCDTRVQSGRPAMDSQGQWQRWQEVRLETWHNWYEMAQVRMLMKNFLLFWHCLLGSKAKGRAEWQKMLPTTSSHNVPMGHLRPSRLTAGTTSHLCLSIELWQQRRLRRSGAGKGGTVVTS